MGGNPTTSVFSRDGSLLPSSHADARSIDDVIAFLKVHPEGAVARHTFAGGACGVEVSDMILDVNGVPTSVASSKAIAAMFRDATTEITISVVDCKHHMDCDTYTVRRDAEGSYGMRLEDVDDLGTCSVFPLAGGPAEAAGIVSGMGLMRVNGSPAFGSFSEQVAEILTGTSEATFVLANITTNEYQRM